MRISDWSSDVCSSDLFVDLLRCDLSRRRAAGQALRRLHQLRAPAIVEGDRERHAAIIGGPSDRFIHHPGNIGLEGLVIAQDYQADALAMQRVRSEEHTSELQSLMRISYAVFCLKK